MPNFVTPMGITLYFYNNQQGAPVIALTGNGNAITNGDATPSVSDDTDFGATAKAATVTKTYTITNDGDADLTITAISVPSGYTLTDPVLPITITPGNNDTFSVRFDATTYQTYAGNITISSDELPDFVFAITAVATYALTVLATSPLRYNKLNEGSGTSIVDSSGNGYTGTYTGVTWDGTLSPFGEAVPFFDGANDYGNLYSVPFGTAFNMDEFTILLWLKVNSAAVWTDGTLRRILFWQRDANNFVDVFKASANNTLTLRRHGAGTTKTVTSNTFTETDWICIAISCSIAGGGLLSAGDFRAYKNGAQLGTTQTGNLAATGSGLGASTTLLGAGSTTPSQVHHGYKSQLIVDDAPMTAAKLALMSAS